MNTHVSSILLNSPRSTQNTQGYSSINEMNQEYNLENNIEKLNISNDVYFKKCSLVDKNVAKVKFSNISKKIDQIPLEIITNIEKNQNSSLIDQNETEKRKIINEKQKIIQSKKGYTGPRNGIIKVETLLQYCKVFGINCPKKKDDIIDSLIKAIKEYEEQFSTSKSTQIASVSFSNNNEYKLENIEILSDEDEEINFSEDED